jgi:hypothetical protein
MPIQQQKINKIKGVTDVLFCIDTSGSMEPCLEGVKNNVNLFIDSMITANPNVKIDWRIGFCGQNTSEFLHLDFTTDVNKFKSELAKVETNANEYTPAAIDYCLTKFDWRPSTSKFLVVFTDEVAEGGFEPDYFSEKFDELLTKIQSKHIYLHFYGPRCKFYGRFYQQSRCFPEYLGDKDFQKIDFSSLLTKLGKTVSNSVSSPQQTINQTSSSSDMIFDLNEAGISIRKI